MNADICWAVIGTYNQHTWPHQVALLIVVALSLLLSYTQRIRWAAKCALGIVNLFIGIGSGTGRNRFSASSPCRCTC